MTALRAKYLKDYRPPAYWVDTVALTFELGEEAVVVTAETTVRRNNTVADASTPLEWDGRALALVSVHLDGRLLEDTAYRVDSETLTILSVPDRFDLKIVTRIHPRDNTALEGLYRSGDLFCTQCEAEGFRKITYYPDRPDVMAVYTCTIIADTSRYPVLLANGNPVAEGVLPDGRHFVRWHDPFPKPSYLFALVAGNLEKIEDRWRTCSGRDVTLRIYVEAENIDKCDHAMRSLKNAMQWDEIAYGREYDLDIFMIVAVKDFNMGAMENKGLNIFNAKYVLARPETATDTDYQYIEGVIGHEYFHNWTGNRVTLKNWFQLSLKEGLTVFRDQMFSADMASRAVKRISDVRRLRAFQFPEDAGPMAHPVRPPSYVQMNNFYTQTVYQKGAEVVRMLHTLLGPERFRKGTDLYFQKYDGQAVTTDDFVQVMEIAGERDLSRFRRWYDQAGTPVVAVDQQYDAHRKTCTLHFRQTCPPTPGQKEKKPFHIPVAVGFVGGDGKSLQVRRQGHDGAEKETHLLELFEEQAAFSFSEVPAGAVASILRGFSAPVRLEAGYSDSALALLMAHDTDPYVRWDAGQQFVSSRIHDLISDFQAGAALSVDPALLSAMADILADQKMDKALAAMMLTLPSEMEIGQQMAERGTEIDPDAAHHVRRYLRREIGTQLRDTFLRVYEANTDIDADDISASAMAGRALKNLALAYMAITGRPEDAALVHAQYDAAANMTDVMAALTLIADMAGADSLAAVERFYEKWRHDDLVLEKWFAVQAMADVPEALERVRGLMAHPDFSIRNPNKVRALIGSFCNGNPYHFHNVSGEGYGFLGEQVMRLDRINPQIAARLAAVFNPWKKYGLKRQGLMKSTLERIRGLEGLSTDVAEIVAKALSVE